MVHRYQLRLAAALVVVAAAGCSRGSNVSNAAPRISFVPAQSTLGGTPFSIDLSTYVTDREGVTMTYAVTTGGGSFAVSTYTNTFDTMGSYTVEFTVSDGSKVTPGSFTVAVKSANLVVVKEDNSGLFLIDSATNKRVQVAASASLPTFAAGLADGRLVYQIGSPLQLWVFDPMARTSTRVGGDANGAVTYRAKTTDSKLVYTTGAATDQTIWFYNPMSDFSREIDQGGLSTTDVFVNSAGLVFYEAGVSGQADIFYYDPADDENVTVGDAITDEQILATLPNGGIVFSRVGGSGEADLFYYRLGTGLVEIGSDIGALANLNKTYNANGSASQVVFTVTNTGNREIYSWDPATGQTATVVAGTDNVYDGIGDNNEVVYHTVVSGSEHDVFCYDLDTQATVTVRNSTDISAVLAVTGGTTAFAIVENSSVPGTLHAVSLVASPVTTSWVAGGATAATVGQLANGDVTAERVDGTAINFFDVSGGAWGTPIAGTGLSFEGDGLDSGDFVYTITAAAQTDLSMWDESGGASVPVTITAGTDDYQALTANGTILFTRVVAPNTTADLFVWDGTTETRLTQADSAGLLHDHVVLGKFAGSR